MHKSRIFLTHQGIEAGGIIIVSLYHSFLASIFAIQSFCLFPFVPNKNRHTEYSCVGVGIVSMSSTWLKIFYRCITITFLQLYPATAENKNRHKDLVPQMWNNLPSLHQYRRFSPLPIHEDNSYSSQEIFEYIWNLLQWTCLFCPASNSIFAFS
jgi:hypothetical protein